MTPSIYVRVWRFGLTVASVLLFDFFTMTPDAHAQVPGIINYQGRVLVNGTNYTGNGQFKFALVDGSGTTTYWSNGAILPYRLPSRRTDSQDGPHRAPGGWRVGNHSHDAERL